MTPEKQHKYDLAYLRIANEWGQLSYERVKVEEKTETNSNLLVLNSNDQMLFDKSVLKAKAGEEVNLLLNHTGQIGKEFMGHNFVLLKNGVDVDDYRSSNQRSKWIRVASS